MKEGKILSTALKLLYLDFITTQLTIIWIGTGTRKLEHHRSEQV